MLARGEVPERLNGAVLKTVGRKPRGFESHPLRQMEQPITDVEAMQQALDRARAAAVEREGMDAHRAHAEGADLLDLLGCAALP